MTAHANPRKPKPEVLEAERQTLELRRAGVSFDVIAKRLGYASRGSAAAAVKRALARAVPEAADDVRELEVDRLDRLLFAVWPAAMKSDPKAIDQALKIAERRARLLGLDVPTTTAEIPPPKNKLIWEEVADDGDRRSRPSA